MKVGISGHQKISPSNSLEWVKKTLRIELEKLNPSTGISCLAIGTDQIFAAFVLERRMKLEAVIPCEAYESAFNDEISRSAYRKFEQLAAKCWKLKYPQPSEEAFLRAGERVVDLSDVMFFVWDGKPAAGLGGTADIVAYTQKKKIPLVHLNPSNCSVKRTGY